MFYSLHHFVRNHLTSFRNHLTSFVMGVEDPQVPITQDECAHVMGFNCVICSFTTATICAIVVLLIGLTWWLPFVSHNIITECEITNCTQTPYKCYSDMTINGIEYYNVEYNCTNTCISYEILQVTKTYCNTNSTFQCNNNGADTTIQCYYNDENVEDTLSVSLDYYNDQLGSIHTLFGIMAGISGLFALIGTYARCGCWC